MIVPAQSQNLQVKPRWVAPVGVMESVVAYNCRKYGMPLPVLAMPMWEGAGNRAMDLSGYGNHGDFTNNAKWVGTIKGIGTEFPTDNGSDRINLGSIDSSNPLSGVPTGEITIVSNVHMNTLSPNNPWPRVFDKSNAGNATNGWMLYFLNSSKIFHVYVDGSLKIASGVVSTPAWITVATTLKSGDNKIYINGIENNTSSYFYTFSSTTTNAAIGNWNHSTHRQWNGTIQYIYIWDCILSAAQIKFLYDNPYFMYRMPEELYGYVAAGGTIRELSTTIPITTLTSTPDINILREIASTSATVTSTNAIDVLMLRELVSTIPITTLTSDISANILREITSTSATSTSASAADLNILRELVATIAVQMGSAGSLKIMRELVTSIDTLTALSQIELLVAGLIEFSATIATTTSTSAAKLNILRELTATIASQTGSSAILDVLREITSTISVTTSTSDIELITMVLRELATTIATTTATSSASFNIVRNLESVVATGTSLSDIILIVPQLRELIATIAATTTTSTPNLNVIRPLLSTISTETSTSDVSLAILRALTAQIATGTDVSDAAALVLRELTSTVSTETLTSSINLLVGAVALLVDTEIVSLTPERTVNSITDIRTLSSLTVDRTIESI